MDDAGVAVQAVGRAGRIEETAHPWLERTLIRQGTPSIAKAAGAASHSVAY
jgi:hypothetical protein